MRFCLEKCTKATWQLEERKIGQRTEISELPETKSTQDLMDYTNK